MRGLVWLTKPKILSGFPQKKSADLQFGQPAKQNKIVYTDCHGVNTFTMVNFKLPISHH
jgi:hypothetical protein